MCPEANGVPKSASDDAITVLLVEDEVLVRASLAEYLRDEGFTVVEAASANEARAYLEAEFQVDLVFSDINTPGVGEGLALSRWISATYPELPVALTSGTALNPNEALGANVIGFFPKPYRHADIARFISERLRTAD
jgi:CheY-like chemotaxis protein